MAVGVVDGLESVQVQVQHREAPLLAARQRHLGHQTFHELGAVVQASQHVMAGQVFNVLLVLMALRHIGVGAQQATARHRNAANLENAPVGPLAHDKGGMAGSDGAAGAPGPAAAGLEFTALTLVTDHIVQQGRLSSSSRGSPAVPGCAG